MAARSVSPRWAAVAGWILAGASVLFLVVIARERRADIASVDLTGRDWVVVALLAVAYGASLFLLAGGWHCLLRSLDAAPDDPRVSIRSFTTSQLAKYVPGNVFHYVGRHMILRKESLPHGRLVFASALEAVLMLLAAGLVVLFVVATARPQVTTPGWSTRPEWWGAILVVLVVSVGVVAVVMVRRAGSVRSSWLLLAVGSYVVFFAVMGAIFNGAAQVAGGAPGLLTAGSGVAGWMAGFVTPGAPAGVGTREAATVLFGGTLLPGEVLLVAAGLFRIVTLVGDVLCFAGGYLLPVRKE
ncbi:MAG: hypothetical protein ABR500_00350 [Dermatophilaceae bacterium]|nr:hypothetical protein [Intrasporangiaceae bacterium]